MVIINSNPLSLDEAFKSVIVPVAGGLSFFVGTVRDNNLDHQVTFLEYEAYTPMAEKETAVILGEAAEEWDICKSAVYHRTGRVNIGEASTIIAVSSKHRAECQAACKYILNELKSRVPLWKKEHFSDGSVWLENQESGSWQEPLNSQLT